jgi:putative ABC transport system permease protein
VLAITLQDLRFRFRQFLIAVLGAGLVFSMALLLTGLANSFRAEVRTTIDAIGADHWVVSAGSSGPFTAFGAIPAARIDELAAGGASQADPLVIVPETTSVDGEVRSMRMFGHRVGGLGTPSVDRGRSVQVDGEVVADRRLGLGLGDRLELVGIELTVVGLVEGHTLLGGIPNVYVTVADAQRIAFQGQPLLTTIVVRGEVGSAPLEGLSVLSSEDVRRDTVHAMRDAIASIDNSRSLMWIVAAVIVAALMYVSSLERLRDFAVLKSLGSPSWLLFVGVALQSIVVTLFAALFALGASRLMKPMFALPTSVPMSAYVVLPIVAVIVGLVSSLVALRRAVSVDPASAFAGAT